MADKLEQEFHKRYQCSIELTQLADAHPEESEKYLVAIEYIDEFQRWLAANGSQFFVGEEALLAIQNTRNMVAKHVDARLEELELQYPAPGVEEEWQAWRRVWVFIHHHRKATDVDTHLGILVDRAALRQRGGVPAYIVVPQEEDLEAPPPVVRHIRHSHWEEVVDLQDELIRFWYTDFGRAYGRAFGRTMLDAVDNPNDVREEQLLPGHPPWTPQEAQWAERLDALERKSMQLANPIWISPDVQKLILHGASHPDFELESLKVEDVFPNLYGFAVFPKSIAIVDQKGKTLRFKAVSWMPVGAHGRIDFDIGQRITPQDADGLFITAYTHRDEPDDYPVIESIGELDYAKFGVTSPPVMSICYITPWRFNGGVPIDMTHSGLIPFCSVMQTLWRFAKQTIVVPESTRLPRTQRRRAERSNLQSDVVVVKLRKRKRKTSSTRQGSKWTVRTIVGLSTGGFWRNQWHPKEQVHRQIWIDPYEAGPEDAPLVLKPLSAFEITR